MENLTAIMRLRYRGIESEDQALFDFRAYPPPRVRKRVEDNSEPVPEAASPSVRHLKCSVLETWRVLQ